MIKVNLHVLIFVCLLATNLFEILSAADSKCKGMKMEKKNKDGEVVKTFLSCGGCEEVDKKDGKKKCMCYFKAACKKLGECANWC